MATVHPSSHSTPPSRIAFSREYVAQLTEDLPGVDRWVASVGGTRREMWSGEAFLTVPADALDR